VEKNIEESVEGEWWSGWKGVLWWCRVEESGEESGEESVEESVEKNGAEEERRVVE
jgi:hypothetical protein